MTKLDGYNIIGGNPDLIFGIEVDTIFYDSTLVTQTLNDFSAAERIGDLSGITISDIPEGEANPMPIAGKVIGIVWMVNNNTATPQTHTINIFKNGVQVATAVIVVDHTVATPGEWFRSDALAIDFVAGDRIQFGRTKSGATNAGIKGVFGVCVSWS